MALLPSTKHLGACLLSLVRLTSCQQPTAARHFKSNHDDPPRSIVSSRRRRRTFSLSDLGFLVKLDTIVHVVSWQIHQSGALLSIRHGVRGGLMSTELTVAVGTTMVGLVHRILL
jgi:hypothetical protein